MNRAIGFFATGAALIVLAGPVAAQDDDEVMSSDSLVEALQQKEEKPRTRSLTRSFGVQATENKQKVDLNIPFEYNSSELAPEAENQLMQLSDALRRDELGEFHFEIAGHTDASGSADYNKSLSQRRADSVTRFLIDHGVDRERLRSVGHGEEKLLNPDDPGHPDNRRVEITNLGAMPGQ